MPPVTHGFGSTPEGGVQMSVIRGLFYSRTFFSLLFVMLVLIKDECPG